ncbi:MAG: SUF system Fe-S cluster assembly regulator [Rhodospirillaceae bacterium]
MIKIGKLTDYAVVVLDRMSRDSGLHTVSDLAERTGIPATTVAKLLKQLAAAGLVSSHRGVNGGYALNLSPGLISVAAIIIALEGPIAVTECVSNAESACGTVVKCSMRGNWEKINQAVRSALESVSLADMSAPSIFLETGR